jgi:hypothetical protein
MPVRPKGRWSYKNVTQSMSGGKEGSHRLNSLSFRLRGKSTPAAEAYITHSAEQECPVSVIFLETRWHLPAAGCASITGVSQCQRVTCVTAPVYSPHSYIFQLNTGKIYKFTYIKIEVHIAYIQYTVYRLKERLSL